MLKKSHTYQDITEFENEYENNGFQIGIGTQYTSVLFNPDTLQVIEYCEGDITLKTCDSLSEFNRVFNEWITFHKENN